ncbi:MAG: cell division protein FtsH [Candidatus Cloacimonetes bacterium 4572_65]|nr:MAG: cell division protein FtsH [Candidatus Cloacimonetes bacterium 4572_65]
MSQDNQEKKEPQGKKGGKGQLPSPIKNKASLLIIIVLGAILVYSLFQETNNKKEIDNSTFMTELLNQEITEAVIEGKVINYKKGDESYFTRWSQSDFEFKQLLIDNTQGKVKEKVPSKLETILVSWLPFLLMILFFWFFMFRNMNKGQNSAFSFGKSKAKRYQGSKTKVNFDDVAGVDEAKEELHEIVEYLKNPKKFQRLGGRIPKGILLVGRPGTGKTLLAKAVAGEANVPFFSVSGSDFVEMFVGVGASRVRDLFAQAKKNSPAIAFIDELDAVGRHRGSGLGGGHDEREQTLNQLLVEMDGFEMNESVIIIAATNRPDVLDPALLRPGRFDRQVVVDLPDINGRSKILKVHSRKIPLADEINLKVIARATPGFSGAELANLVNEAALIAARHSKEAVEMEDFEEAKDKLTLGKQKKSRVVSEEDRKITSYHEIGHVVCSLFEKHGEPAHKVSIIPRGLTGGATHFLGNDKSTYSKSFLEAMLVHLLGGRAAEKIIFDEITTGASNDIDRATDIVKQMVCNWGMSDKIGPLAVMKQEKEVFLGKQIGNKDFHSEDVAKMVDSEIHYFIDKAYVRAQDTLNKHRDLVDAMAEVLLEKETLNAEDIFSIVKQHATGEDLAFAEAKYNRSKALSFEIKEADKKEA